MLSFLSPLFLAGAAAVAVPLILHLLKREPEPRVKFAAVKLLKRAPVEQTEKRHIRELLLLALRVAALVLLAIAFARPFLASGAAVGATGVTMIALDTSYSMSAPGRFERAKQLAKDAISKAPGGNLVGVVTFDDVAEIVEKPSADRVLARAAVDRASAGFGSTRYRAGLSAAAQMLSGHRGTVVVVTDLQESGWDVGDRISVPESARIDVADVGPLTDDLAVTGLRSAGDRLVATVRNVGSRAVDARLHLSLDGRAAGETTVPVGPNTSADVPLPIAGRPVTASVAVEDPHGVEANNVRYAVVGESSRSSVLVVSGTGDLGRDSFYLQAALQAKAAGATTYDVVGVSGSELASWTAARLRPVSAIVFVSTRGLERHARELVADYVTAGGGIIVAAGPDVDGEVIGDVLGGTRLRVTMPADTRPQPRTLAPADVRHPIFQRFGANAATLGLVQFQRVSRVAGDGCQTLARFTSGEAALVDCASGEGRALVLASDLNNGWNNFPLHATFVPFVHEAVQYVAGARPRAAEYVIGDVPPGIEQRPGIATMQDPAGQQTRVAVNVDARESDPARMSADDFQAVVTRLKDAGTSEARIEARQQEEHQHLWQYAIILMLMLLALEGLVASRTA
ncbi:MAG TPA: BatA domain-containing protein [Vicinamibacterales bacterium]|jgi:hypothetical protein